VHESLIHAGVGVSPGATARPTEAKDVAEGSRVAGSKKETVVCKRHDKLWDAFTEEGMSKETATAKVAEIRSSGQGRNSVRTYERAIKEGEK